MSEVFEFAPEFQLSILRLMARDLSFLTFCIDILKTEYFDTTPFRWYYCVLRDFYKDHRALADKTSVKNEIKKAYLAGKFNDFNGKAYIDIYNALWDDARPSISYIQKELTKFAYRQALIRAIKSSPDLIEDGKYDELVKRVNSAKEISNYEYDVGHAYFSNYEGRLAEVDSGIQFERAIPTGLSHLDNILNFNGLAPKELGVVLSPPHTGKTTFLISAAKRAVFAGKKVWFVSLEMTKEKIAARFDSAFSGIHTKLIGDCHSSVDAIRTHDASRTFSYKTKPLLPRLEQLKNIFGNSLIIKEYPTDSVSVEALDGELDYLRAAGFYPDLVLVDYADIMRPIRYTNDSFQDQGAIYKELRGFAMRHDLAVWTGCQTNRGGFSKKIIKMEDMGESIKKAAIADVIIALCQSEDEKMLDIMRIFVTKNRDGKSGQLLPIRTDFEHMQFHKIGPGDTDPNNTAELTKIALDYMNQGSK